MLARIQQLIVAAIVALVVGGAIAAIWLGHPAWALTGPVLVVGGYVAALGLEFHWLRSSYAKGSEDRPRVDQLLSAWLAEALIAPRVFLWRQPFRYAAIADALPAEAQGRRGVVLVHGFFCNRGLWNPWMKRLLAQGTPFIAVTLEPPFGSIDRYADAIERAVARVESATGEAPVLVAHSMGGLAVRAWLARDGRPGRVHRVVTIATPHRGTSLARHSVTQNGHEMRLDSPWLAALARTEGESGYARFTCFWGHCDNIVFPTRVATLPGADNRHLPHTPHVAMAFHPDVFEHVQQCLRPA
ncbi:MAG: alpha/beta fold hydrolase [Burkholderiales bacterium]|nr:alpha/beta fold hydrolase [Burkholderiales bacterium]